MITETLRNFLIDSADVRDKIDGRIYAGRVPEGGRYPCIVQQILNTEPAYCTLNESGTSDSIVTLDVYGNSQVEVDTISNSVRNRLSGYEDFYGIDKVRLDARMISSQNLINRPVDGSSNWIYQNSMDYQIYYNNPIPTHT